MKWLSIRNPLTLREVIEVEKDLDVVFPDDYKRIIGPINGGALENAYINHPIAGRIAYSRNVPLNRDSKGNIFVLFDTFRDENNALLPFGSVGDGDYYCFDLDNDKKVVIWEHEPESIIDVCETFTQLMDMLKEE